MKKKLKVQLKNILSFWRETTFAQRISSLSLFTLLVFISITSILKFTVYAIGSIPITPITPPITPPTPTATLTPTPTATPTPTITSTPTPTPKPNKQPVITTFSLPTGKVKVSYKATVRGYDLDINDVLIMTISQLPSGLKQEPCNQKVEGRRQKTIECQISGIPQQAGVFNLTVTLSDNRGSKAVKKLLLQIIPNRSISTRL